MNDENLLQFQEYDALEPMELKKKNYNVSNEPSSINHVRLCTVCDTKEIGRKKCLSNWSLGRCNIPCYQLRYILIRTGAEYHYNIGV